MRRASFIRRVSKKKARADRDLIAVKAKVVERSQGRCEARFSSHCTGAATAFHHRQPRSAGGRHTEANLLHVCQVPCHAELHAYPIEAHALGLLVHAWEDPAEIPVRQSELS